MVAPEFIVPPPGLIPNAPEPSPEQRQADASRPDDLQPHTGSVPGATDRTVRAVPVRPFPAFTPLPTAPPSALVSPAVSAPPAAVTAPTPTASAPPAELTMPPAFLPSPAPTAASAPTFHLVGDDGTEVEISGRCVLGRNPVSGGASADARPVALADATRTVSKTHALIEVRDGRVIVTDLHSTNGVAVQAGGGEVTVLDAGAPAAVDPGSVLRLGDLALTLRRSAGLTV